MPDEEKPYACTWELLYECNYRCPYCFLPFDAETSAAYPGQGHPDAAAWIGFWKRLFEERGSFLVSLTGGEVSLHRDFFLFLEEVGRWHSFRITTNLSWDVDRLIGRADPSKISFGASFHPHFAVFDTYAEKLLRLKAAGFGVSAMMVAYPPLLEKVPAYLERLRGLGVPVSLDPFHGLYNGRHYPEAYSEQERLWLRESDWSRETIHDIKLGARRTRDLPCEAGARYFRVLADGSVYRCLGAKDIPLGNIRDADFRLKAGPAPCPSDRCMCGSEYIYLKGVDPKKIFKAA